MLKFACRDLEAIDSKNLTFETKLRKKRKYTSALRVCEIPKNITFIHKCLFAKPKLNYGRSKSYDIDYRYKGRLNVLLENFDNKRVMMISSKYLQNNKRV